MHTILSDNLEKHLEGRLPAEIQASLDAHLAECHDCQTELSDMLDSRQMLSLLAVTEDDPALEPAPGFALKVMANIEAAQRPSIASGWLSILHFPMVRQLAMAAFMLAILCSGYAFTLKSTEASPTAELMVDLPTYREAPATVFAHHHSKGEHGICLACWKSSRVSTASSTNDDVREVALASLITDDE
jgi:anti-sigma factor RsiW